MIKPLQTSWWHAILLNEDGYYKDPGYDLVELMSNEHDIPSSSARRICVGAKKEGILREDPTYGDLEFRGVNQSNHNKTPDWVEQARDLARNGVTTFGENDILLFDGSLLVKKSSQNIASINQNLCYQVKYDRLLEYIQRTTVLDRPDIESILEKEKGETGILNYQDGAFVSEIEGVSIIKEW